MFLYILLIYTAPRCGDGRCNGNEDSISCVQDCGTLCGDGVCNGDETPCNCVSDCGECSSQEVCKKAFCNQEEQCIISIKEPCCGNGKIELGETCANCNQDVVCDSNQTCCNEQCLEIKWVCSDWSPCTNTGTQTRNCVETTGCLTNQYKPLEIQDRSYIPSIGEKLVVGNFEYHFKGLTEKKSVGDKSVYFTNEANGVYYILDFKITNVGKKADIIPLDQILIVDYDENEYSYDSSALFYLSNAISFYEQLNPGVSISGKIAYDVPKGLKGKLKIGDGSLLSPSYKEFNLKK